MSITISRSSIRYGAAALAAPAATAGSGQAKRTGRRALPALAVFVLALSAGTAACGSSSDNGVAASSPDAIVAAAKHAADGAKAVHVSGSLTSGGTPISLNLTLVNGKGAIGQLSENGMGVRIVVLNKTAYFNGSDAMWRRVGGTVAVQLLHGRWMKAPISGQFADFAKLTDVTTLFNTLLSHHGNLAKGSTSTVAGRRVVAVNDTTNGGTLYVATTGKPYPVQVSGTSGGSSGRVVFDRYNQSVSLSPPANSIDITKLPGFQS